MPNITLVSLMAFEGLLSGVLLYRARNRRAVFETSEAEPQ